MDLEMNPLNSNGNFDNRSNGSFAITDAQKRVILNCMQDFKYVQAKAVEEWSQGEWDFFADKCMEMGLDPENIILYPEEDTEIEDVEEFDGFDSVHVGSHLKKLGSHSEVGLFAGYGFFNLEAEDYKQVFKGKMNPSTPNPTLIDKPPDPPYYDNLEQSEGRRSSPRLAVKPKSRKGKEGKDSPIGSKHAPGFVKLNLSDFMSGTELSSDKNFQLRDESVIPAELGLNFGGNGVTLSTSGPLEDEDMSSQFQVQEVNTLPHQIDKRLDEHMEHENCPMNTAADIPLSPDCDPVGSERLARKW
ncbi:hypothetical protein L1987_50221 [Smallanthus sonchifolius]|uniref:Uncharacterized protein n=1 Tax=Smallanthus sonchifolius TaxID=185202 RepID=A0ACB9FXV5_9ASTR|nr:hypothetical protein L1987_50221 [Smallanthus sonchifolius]